MIIDVCCAAHFRFICCITLTLLLLLWFWWRQLSFFPCSRRPMQVCDWLIERNSWFVAKKVKVCARVWSAIYIALRFRATRTCTSTMLKENKSGRQNALCIYIIRRLRMRTNTISRYSIIIAWYSMQNRRKDADKCRQRETHSDRIIYYYCTHSISNGFGALLLFVDSAFEILLEGFIAVIGIWSFRLYGNGFLTELDLKCRCHCFCCTFYRIDGANGSNVKMYTWTR